MATDREIEKYRWSVERLHEEPGGAVAELMRQRDELLEALDTVRAEPSPKPRCDCRPGWDGSGVHHQLDCAAYAAEPSPERGETVCRTDPVTGIQSLHAHPDDLVSAESHPELAHEFASSPEGEPSEEAFRAAYDAADACFPTSGANKVLGEAIRAALRAAYANDFPARSTERPSREFFEAALVQARAEVERLRELLREAWGFRKEPGPVDGDMPTDADWAARAAWRSEHEAVHERVVAALATPSPPEEGE